MYCTAGGNGSHAPLQDHRVGAPMKRVGVDILGPFPLSARVLVEKMFSRFGAPKELHSDQGRNFKAEVFATVCARLVIHKSRTTPLHPQSDGLV